MEALEIKTALEGIKAQVETKATEQSVEVKGLIEALEVKMKAEKDATVLELKADLKSIQDHADKLDVKLQAKNKNEMGKKTVSEELKEKKAEIKSLVSGMPNVELELKALTTRASVSDNALGFFIPEITQLGYKERSLYNVLPKVAVSDSNTGGTVRYRDWDEATTVRAAAMVAEGAAFPESTAKFKWYSEDLRKVGDTLPVTEEFFEDEAQAAAELEMFLNVNVNLVIDSQLINGDATGQNLKGLINVSPAYTAVASGISAPNLKDLAIKVKNDITRTRGSKYSPDMLLVNSLTMESLILKKDANNNYIFDENTGTLGGLFVVVDENMPDNQMIVGDRKYARIYEKSGVVISKGMPNAQFLEDEMTIKARKRMLLLVKTGDRTGFRKVISVSAALATLAT
jgi:HK97 family phage major capsid protein